MLSLCGVDPGLKGGITFLTCDNDGSLLRVKKSFVMPTKKNVQGKIKIDGAMIAAIMDAYKPDSVMIEAVAARPEQGVTSVFSFGYGAGLIEGVLEGLAIPYEKVWPQAWMKVVFAGLPKKEAKSSIAWVKMKFPEYDWRATLRSKKVHEGMSDSAALAYFAYLKTLKK